MANLITKFRYYKSNKSKARGRYAKYIATREGVELINESLKDNSATKNQLELIEKILKDYPDSIEMLEYDDFIKSPTVKNASEFITRAIEDNVNVFMSHTTYADYIATRPRVEKNGRHGLFSSVDEEINLEKVSDDISKHNGNIWTMIVSLRREDAERLGYNNAARWREMIRSKTEEISTNFKIPLSHLKWYGAFHNEGHHPHVHIIIYADNEEGYLTKQGINKMRSSLANTIFEDDIYHIAEEQTKIRNELKSEWKDLLKEIMNKIASSSYENKEIQDKLIELSIRLRNTKSKKQYGYLKKDVKDLIDSIVDLLAEDEDISKLYDLWYEEKYKILKMYSQEMPPKIPLSKNKEFNSIKNDIIREALRILMSDEGDMKILPPPGKKKDKQYYDQKNKYYASKQGVSATAVTRLFKNLANIFSDKLITDDSKKVPVIDKRQRKEIEDKKNAELTMT